jgi:hypothetical protein
MMTRQTLLRTTVAAGLLALGLAGCGHMQMSSNTTHLHAALSGSQEVPPKPGAGKGEADVELNTANNTVSWKVSYSGLSGPATAGHIHGPAAMGANAGVMVPFPSVASSTFQGQATVTPAQAAAIASGQTYVNIHTAANPGGEIRGQLTKM